MLISMKSEEVSRMLTRPIKRLKEFGEAFAPLVEQLAEQAADRPWWDIWGKLFGHKPSYAVVVAGVGSLDTLQVLITRLESMKDLCDKYGSADVLVSHEDLHHIEAATRIVEQGTKVLMGMDIDEE